ncbi:cyclase family protein [Candidatus Protochlamydia phocaeensis]|uniref:cyclase family protein n=1 Tax=Candidatus Protochlamydia phocaeensis TaxID=1414722 RepID=UPI00083986E3|nr:cyclase family protein [Candidatus Protochlamydia phocaeensis]
MQTNQQTQQGLSFWPLLQKLHKGTFVDLTHAFDPHIPHFETAVPMEVEDVSTHKDKGIWVQRFHFEGQWGTHVDAPAHFCEGLRTVAQIPLQEMILPLVVVDIHDKVAGNPDYILLVDDLLTWENQYGRIPKGAFVALRTDWSKHWPDDAAMHNRDEKGVSRTPGWGLDALAYLYEDCEVTATGHETIDPDPGFRAKETNWACERYILNLNHYQIELLTNLDRCPPTGAIVICTFPKPSRASGFPARVIAICP